MFRRCDPEFEAKLDAFFSQEELDRHPDTVCGLWPDTRLAYVNPAWERFAEENGGQPGIRERWDLGARYLDAVPESLRPFYEDLLKEAPERGETLRPLTHEYECSSAESYRKYHMQVYALPNREGYVIVNSSVVEQPHDAKERPAYSPEADVYADVDGTIRQCAHCRRVQRTEGTDAWDWIPAWVERCPESTSHVLCPICFDYYYPEVARDTGG